MYKTNHIGAFTGLHSGRCVFVYVCARMCVRLRVSCVDVCACGGETQGNNELNNKTIFECVFFNVFVLREKERERESQAGPVLSAQSPTWGSIP